MHRVAYFALLLLLTSCTKAELKDSISKSMEGACRNNPGHCTVYDETGKTR